MRDPYNEIRRCVYDGSEDGWRPETEPARVFHGGTYLVLDEAPARFEPVLRAGGLHNLGIRPIVGLDHGPDFHQRRVLLDLSSFRTLAVGDDAEGGTYPFSDFYGIHCVSRSVGQKTFPSTVLGIRAVDLADAEQAAVSIAADFAEKYRCPVRVAGCVPVVLEGPLSRSRSVERTFFAAIAARDHWFERAAKPRATGRPISARTRFLVLRRDGYRCQICGATAADGTTLHVDHKLARSKGGTNEESNLWTLCAPCNLGKSDLSL